MRTRSSTGFNTIPENVAAVVFSHLGKDPKDRIRLAAVSKVWRSAEKSDASLPGTPRALCEFGKEFNSAVATAELLNVDASEHWKAFYWFEKSADHGDPEGMFWFGKWYLYGGCTGGSVAEENYTKAVHWFKRASELGHAEATRMVALCYEDGHGMERDFAKAIEWNVKAAELGWGFSAWWLGSAHLYGQHGLTENNNEALKWYRLAVELGDADTRQHWWEMSRMWVNDLEAELAAA